MSGSHPPRRVNAVRPAGGRPRTARSSPCPASSSNARSRAPGTLTEQELARSRRRPTPAVASLGVPYTWVTSYVTADKIYCVHDADGLRRDPRARAAAGGFPADVITEVVAEFGPHTALAGDRSASDQRRRRTVAGQLRPPQHILARIPPQAVYADRVELLERDHEIESIRAALRSAVARRRARGRGCRRIGQRQVGVARRRLPGRRGDSGSCAAAATR